MGRNDGTTVHVGCADSMDLERGSGEDPREVLGDVLAKGLADGQVLEEPAKDRD